MDGKDMACNCVRVYHAGQYIPAASHCLVDRLARLTKNIRRIPSTRDCLQSAIFVPSSLQIYQSERCSFIGFHVKLYDA